MVLEAEANGCLHEVMVIASALSIQDPRERPTEKQQAAAEMHARFADASSDFLTLLNLWNYLQEQQDERSSSQFRKLCKTEYLNYLRVREWQDIYGQLRQVVHAKRSGSLPDAVDRDRVHQSLLAGLLSHIGVRATNRQDYDGARGARFAIAPGSVLFKRSPRWVMAAELVETNRLWGRVVARVQPEWAERLAPHLVTYSYSEPQWDERRGAAMVQERVSLYGLTIVPSRRVNYARVDPEAARELFIRHALVDGEWQTHHAFFDTNVALIAELQALEDRARRRDIVVDEDTRFDFYDERIGRKVTSTSHFDQWWKTERARRPDLLTFTRDFLIDPAAGAMSADDFPDVWVQGDVALPVTYEFDLTSPTDGVTVHIPLALVSRVDATGFDWQVPGRRAELVTALVRSLPRPVRRRFVPIENHVRAFLAMYSPADGPLVDLLERHLTRTTGDPVPQGSWRLDEVPDHLRITFRIEDETGDTVAVGKDLDRLRSRLGGHMRAAVTEAVSEVERAGLTAWTIGTLPRTIEAPWGGHTVTAFPALVDEGDTVAVRLFASADDQRDAMIAGTRRLVLLTLPSPTKGLERLLDRDTKLALAHSPYASVDALFDDCVGAALDELIAQAGGPAWDEETFAARRDAVRDGLADAVVDVCRSVGRVLANTRSIESRVARLTSAALKPAVDDVRTQVSHLVYAGFVLDTGAARLRHVARYLAAIERRLDKLASEPARDRELMLRAQHMEDRIAEVERPDPELRWMVEELRVSLFAQSLGTAYPISEKRIVRVLESSS
jgi:ATP-dependent helicase HrpA